MGTLVTANGAGVKGTSVTIILGYERIHGYELPEALRGFRYSNEGTKENGTEIKT